MGHRARLRDRLGSRGRSPSSLGGGRANLSAEALTAAKAAAAIMAMNNVYYRRAPRQDEEYCPMPAGLRMNVIGNPGVDEVDFELWCLRSPP